MSKEQIILNEFSQFVWSISSDDIVEHSTSFFHSKNLPSDFFQPIKKLLSSHKHDVGDILHRNSLTLKTKRLGERFESFWHSAFELHPNYQLITRNYKIFENGKTYGEADCIVKDLVSEQVFHIELSCKFYLGVCFDNEMKWIGPGKQDSLTKKMSRILNHQLRILDGRKVNIDGLELDDKSILSRFVMKGRLFQPLEAMTQGSIGQLSEKKQKILGLSMSESINHGTYFVNNDSIAGFWGTKAHWQQKFSNSGLKWNILAKMDWMTCQLTDHFSFNIEDINLTFEDYPIAIVGGDSNGEKVRGFIVPDSWMDDWLNKAERE